MAIFKSKAFAIQAQEAFNGEVLDGKEMQIELQGPQVKKKPPPKKQNQGKKGQGIESRLGPSIFSRLAPKLEDRLGKKLDDRLGKKSLGTREIKNYADI